MRRIMSLFLALLLMMLSPFPTIKVQARDLPLKNKLYGGTLIWGTCHKPTLINPILTIATVSSALQELIFNSLVRINSQGQIEPDLAKDWDISSDGLTYTFYLRKEVKFHDGIEFTAKDVEFTYAKIIDPQINSPFKTPFKLVKEFKILDDYTFQIILKKPSASFLYKLIREIAPKHLLEDADLKASKFNFKPIGTGPFKFKQWTEDNQIILGYNSDYYEGRPYLDKIIVKTYSDSQDMWAAFMRGEIDFFLFMEKQDYEIVKNDETFKTYAIPVDYYYSLIYNLKDPILQDIRVRKALVYAIDRQSLVEKAAYGYGLVCNGPFYPDSLGFDQNTEVYEYNPDKARQILLEAGWKDSNGILEKDGQELELRILVDSRKDEFERIALVLRQQLQEIGIKIKVINYNDESILTKEFLNKNKIQAQLKLLLSGAEPADQAKMEWSSQDSDRSGRLWSYFNDDVDRLFRAGETTLSKQRRGSIYRKIHQLISEQQPACFLYFRFDFHALSERFKNADQFFNVNMPFYTIKNWYIKERE